MWGWLKNMHDRCWRLPIELIWLISESETLVLQDESTIYIWICTERYHVYVYITYIYIYNHIDEYITIYNHIYIYTYHRYFTAILQVGCFFFSPQLSLAKILLIFSIELCRGKPRKRGHSYRSCSGGWVGSFDVWERGAHRERQESEGSKPPSLKTIQDLNITAVFKPPKKERDKTSFKESVLSCEMLVSGKFSDLILHPNLSSGLWLKNLVES